MDRRRLNILQIINEPWTSAILEYGLVLSKGLKKRGHNVIVVCIRKTPLKDTLEKDELRFEIIDELNNLNPYNIFRSVVKIKDILRREKIDIIDTHRSEGQIIGYFANKLVEKPAVIIRTRGDQRPANFSPFNRYLYRHFINKIIVASKIAKENHFAGFDISDKVIVIPPAVDIDKFNPKISGESFRRKYGIKKDEILVGIVGRLDPVKGHKYFLEAEDILKDKAKFIIIGREENVKIKNLDMPAGVIWTGFHEDVEEAIAGLDIGIIASIGSEALSRVCLEMMACGKPVVGTRVGSIPELIVDAETGFLCNPADSMDLASKISRLISAKDMRIEMGRKGFDRVAEKFSIENMVQKTEEVYYEFVCDNNMHK